MAVAQLLVWSKLTLMMPKSLSREQLSGMIFCQKANLNKIFFYLQKNVQKIPTISPVAYISYWVFFKFDDIKLKKKRKPKIVTSYIVDVKNNMEKL